MAEDDEDFDINMLQEEIIEVKANISEEPVINSKAAVVIDRGSKRVLYSKNAYERKAMASTTKIMTCLIALENSKLDKIITISKKSASLTGSRLGLSEGDKISMNDLLYGLMLCSGNDAAAQIAETIGGSYEDFAKLMNKKALELKLINTHFVTPHGLDNENHYTTAYELALLTDYALKNEKFAEIVSTKTKTVLINGYQRDIYNTNELLGYLDGVNGVKTGFTNNAGRCLVISCERNGVSLISVVLGADTKKFRTKDSIKILEYSLANYSKIDLKSKIENAFKNWKKENNIQIKKGKEQLIKPIMEKMPFEKYLIKPCEEDDIDIVIECKDVLEAPVKQGEQIGNIKVIISGKEIMNLKLTIEKAIEKKSPIDYFMMFWSWYVNANRDEVGCVPVGLSLLLHFIT